MCVAGPSGAGSLAVVSAPFPSEHMPVWQHTLAAPFACSGKGLHSGKPVRLEVLPAPVNAGLVFERADMPGPAGRIEASARAVCATRRCTSLGNASGARIDMVEHVLAALSACGVDNACIRVDGPEVPGMDGCAAEFCAAIGQAGLERQSAPRRFMQVVKPIRLEADGRHVALEPAPGLSIHAFIAYPDTLIGAQSHEQAITPKTFAETIAPARTFALAGEVAALRAAGLASGGSTDNCLVVDAMSLAPGQALRFDNEFARHKILDILGDLALTGAPVLGRYSSHKGGHTLNTALANALLDDPSAWCWVTLA